MKKFIISNIIISIIVCIYSVCAFASTCYSIGEEEYVFNGDSITISLDKETMECDIPPILHEDRTLVPIRALIEKIGGQVEWDEKERSVRITLDKKEIKLKIDSKIAIVDDKEVELDVAACIAYPEGNGAAGRTVVPVRFVMENLGLTVDWEQETHTVIITTDEEPDEEPDETNPDKDEEQTEDNPYAKPDEDEEEEEEEEEEEPDYIVLDEEDYIRIGLSYGSSAKSKTTITADTKIKIGIVNGDEFTVKYIVPAKTSVVLTPDGTTNKVKISVGGKNIATLSGEIRLIPDNDSDDEQIIKVDGRSYRGTIKITKEASKLRVINVLPLEEYLYAVVPSEMPASYGLEALKAQAVAARTYAIYQMGKHNESGFDLCASTHCQAYNGYSNEYSLPTQAVQETTGMVVKYEGKLISTFYSASMGPYTEDVENVWGTYYPYLRSVSNEYEPKMTPGTAYFTKAEIESKLSSRGENIGDVLSVEVTKFTEAGRAYTLVIKGTKGTKTYYRETTRTFFGLKGQMYTIAGGEGILGLIENLEDNAEKDENTKIIAKVTTEVLNVREEPDGESKKLAEVYEGEKYEVLEEEEDFVKIETKYEEDDVIGWISKEFVKITEDTTTTTTVQVAKITTETLNVRKTASTSASILGQVGENEGYAIIDEKSGWVKIIVNEDITGWISKEYTDILTYDLEEVDLEEELADEGITFRIGITVYDNGHGVGMSQNGAKGMAAEGFEYDEILEHYFTGVDVVKM